jgi:hypothetical protein
MVYNHRCFYLPLFLLFFSSISAQSVNDTAFLDSASSNAVKLYNNYIKGQSSLYTGSEYNQTEGTNDQHPFYKDADWQSGSVHYNEEYYENVSLLYDIFFDVIVTENFSNGNEMVLVKAKIKNFSIGDDYFIHLPKNTLPEGLSTPGFYQVLHDGPSKVIVHHLKNYEERIESSKVEKYFTYKRRIYIFKDNAFHRVSKKAELFRLFKDKRSQLRTYAQSEKIKVTRKNPISFGLIASYYDSLNSPKK